MVQETEHNTNKLTVKQILLVMKEELEEHERSRKHAEYEERYLDARLHEFNMQSLRHYISWIEQNGY